MNNTIGRTICTGFMIAVIGLTANWLQPYTSFLNWLSLGWLLVGLIGTIWVEDSFSNWLNIFPKDIHLGELLATTGVLLAWVSIGGNLIYILASVYPSLLIHKGLINLGSGLRFWDHRTDDRSGKTFKIPLLGIKVPRLPLNARISLAVISALVVIINTTSLNWTYTIQDILSWFD